jgi:hypothetical protein
MNKGFVILAENTTKVNYIACAEVLALSIKKAMPKASITLISNGASMCTAFDHVIELPYGDLDKDGDWKLVNDWQVYEATPYEYTIKLEADMYLPKSIDYWWDVLCNRDFVVCTTIRDFRQDISDVRTYRKFLDDNQLPDVYNAITYFKKGPIAEKFFAIVKDIFENWSEYKKILKCNPKEPVSTDWAYAIACHILGIENTTMPNFKEMSFVHMKQHINKITTENWTDTFVYECLPHTFRIQTVPQVYPVHYHIKNFYTKINEGYYE